MIRDLINAFNSEKGSKFVAFTYTNKYGEVAKRIVQVNTSYENALAKDLQIVSDIIYVENDNFSEAVFNTAKAEVLNSIKMSLQMDNDASKEEAEKHSNRSNGQSNAYIKIAKNIKYNVETSQIYIFAKEVRKTILTEGVYPQTNKREKTKAKDFIKKSMKSSQYRTYVISEVQSVKLNGDTIELQ
jgi:hypothetical protein